MASKKKARLRDLTDDELLNEYTKAVRFTWGRNVREKHPGHDPLYQRESSIKREILRRLSRDPHGYGVA